MALYRWLLRLFPASFRDEYGREMLAVFARQRRDARGLAGIGALWTRTIVRAVVARSLTLAVVGIGARVVLAYPAGRDAQSLLARVEPGDGLTFTVAVAVAVAMTVAGSVRPALSAARVDPVSVIRIE